MIRKLLTLSLALTLAVPLRSLSFAQDGPPPPSPAVKKLALDERSVRDSLDQLDTRMHALAGKIQEKQPEEAARLEAAWKLIHDQLIKEDLEVVVQALEEGNLFKALPKERDVQTNLKTVLDILERQRQEDQRELAEKLQSIQDAIKGINKLQTDEQKIKNELAKDRQSKKDVQSIEEAKKALDAVKQEQENLQKG